MGPLWQVLALWSVFVLLGAYVGKRKDRPMAGTLLGALLGPLGVLISIFLPYGGDILCPECGKRTRWVPKNLDTGPPYGSEPHLRCYRCGSIIWDERGAMRGVWPGFQPIDRLMDLLYYIYKKTINREP